MSIFIENYRGKDIFYSPVSEKFFADIDDGKEKNLIHLVRKEIDDYIKANMKFKPFKVFKVGSFSSIFDNPNIKTVTGLRKDGAFQCEDGSQISNYELGSGRYNNECDWFLFDENENDYIIERISGIREDIKSLEQKTKAHRAHIKELELKMAGENLADFKKRITGVEE